MSNHIEVKGIRIPGTQKTTQGHDSHTRLHGVLMNTGTKRKRQPWELQFPASASLCLGYILWEKVIDWFLCAIKTSLLLLPAMQGYVCNLLPAGHEDRCQAGMDRIVQAVQICSSDALSLSVHCLSHRM